MKLIKLDLDWVSTMSDNYETFDELVAWKNRQLITRKAYVNTEHRIRDIMLGLLPERELDETD